MTASVCPKPVFLGLSGLRAQRLSSGPLLSLVVSLVCVCACFFSLDVLEPYGWHVQTLWVGGLATLALCTHLVLRRAWADPFHPDILFSFGHLITFVVFSVIFATGWFDDVLFDHVRDVSTHFPQMIAAVLLGQTLFNAPFCLFPPRPTRRADFGGEGVSGFVVLVALFVWLSRIGILATGSYWHTGSSAFKFESTAYSPMAVMNAVGRIVVAYVALRLFMGHRRKAAMAYLICEVLWASFSGARGGLIMAFIVVILAFVFVRRRLPWTALIGFCALLVVVGGFLGTYRSVIGQQARLGEISVGKAIEKAMSEQKDTTTKIALNLVFDRVNDGQFAAGCMKYSGPMIPYTDGSTYAGIFWTPVPRVLYPDRPELVVNYHAFFSPWITWSSAPVTTVGEAYLNFGWSGIPVVFLLLGMLYRCLACFMGAPGSASQAAVALFYASLLIQMPVDPALAHVSWMMKILLLWMACPLVDNGMRSMFQARPCTSGSMERSTG